MYKTWPYINMQATSRCKVWVRSRSLLGMGVWVQIPSVKWMSVPCECCVFSGRSRRVELIPHLEESYRLCLSNVCELEFSTVRRSWPEYSCSAIKNLVCHNWDAMLMSDSMNLSERRTTLFSQSLDVWLRDFRTEIYFGYSRIMLYLPPVQGRLNELPSSH